MGFSKKKIEERVSEDPRKYMRALGKKLHPDNIGELDYKTLRNYLEIATMILNKHASELGEDREGHIRLVDGAKQHFKERIEKRDRAAAEIIRRLGDYETPLSQSEISKIESSLGRLKDHFGLPEEKEQEIREKLKQRKEQERVAQEVGKLDLYFHDMNEAKLEELRSMFETLAEQHPNHPKVIELGERLDRAEKSIDEQRMRAEIENYLPDDAKPYLATLVSKLHNVESEEGDLEDESTKLLVAVNREALKGMNHVIQPEDFEKSRKVLDYLKLVHEITGADPSHLNRFERLLEEAKKYVPKK